MREGKWICVATSGKRRMISLHFIYAPVFTFGLERELTKDCELSATLSFDTVFDRVQNA